MNFQDVEQLVDLAVSRLLSNDRYLLEHDANERSITHKLAEYLQGGVLGQYHVDCEYNRNIDNVNLKKQVYVARCELERLCKCGGKHQNNTEICELSVFPDIIIHERGSNRRNLLVIEVKKIKENNRDSVKFDQMKLKNYTSDVNGNLHYQYGLFLEFHIGASALDKPVKTWFRKGVSQG